MKKPKIRVVGYDKTVYMCKTDFYDEPAPYYYYDSLKTLKDQRGCIAGCGYVKVKMEVVKQTNGRA